jgi:hypothetical protein
MGHMDDVDLILADAYGLDDDEVLAKRIEQLSDVAGGTRQAAVAAASIRAAATSCPSARKRNHY